MGYDIIGDIHGQADKLRRLLSVMGYSEVGGAWRHPTNRAIFIGDFIDQGLQQLETLSIVKAMVDAGSGRAVLGNHEFNAIAFHTPDPEAPGQFLRPHTSSNISQHRAFLAAVGQGSPRHKRWVDWFRTLPLWLDHPDPFGVVHACWHPDHMAALRPQLADGNCLTPALIEASSRKGSWQYEAVEALLKGLEVALPPGCTFIDKHQQVRTRVRIAWWLAGPISYREGAFVPPEVREELPDVPIPNFPSVGYESDRLVFFGHYWQHPPVKRLTPKVGCVDYSAGTDGPLVAYRWQGEHELTDAHYVLSDQAP